VSAPGVRSTSPKRIGFVLASDIWGGAEIHTLALTARLAARGHQCVIAELDQPVVAEHLPMVAEGVGVRALPISGSITRPRLRSAYRQLRSLGVDVGVFVKGWTMVGTVGFDLACRLAFRGHFLTIEHLTPPPRGTLRRGRHLGGLLPGLGLYWYRQGFAIRTRSWFPSRIATVSQAIATELIEHYGFPRRKVVPIPNGIDGSRFVPDPVARSATRALWGVPEEAVVLGAIGRFQNEHKGHHIAIDLFARLCDAHPEQPLYLILAGNGPDEASLKSQAGATRWKDRIRFPGWSERPWEACAGMDVFLMPSQREGIGLALMEAMACGCCPVVMAVGGIKEVVTDPSVGWSAGLNDRERFYQGMQHFLEIGAAGRAAVGARAREHILRNFRADEQYGKLADLVERT
jgi:glycosyltransferase involved in cell wall biosynthesis